MPGRTTVEAQQPGRRIEHGLGSLADELNTGLAAGQANGQGTVLSLCPRQ